MKVLYVYGDDDYAALTFEDELRLSTHEGLIKSYDEAIECGGETEIVDGIYAVAMQFESVDMKFIKKIKNEVMDYDSMKHSNFYVVEE